MTSTSHRLIVAALGVAAMAAACATPVSVARVRPGDVAPAAVRAISEAWQDLAKSSTPAELADATDRYNAGVEALFDVPGAELRTDYFDEIVIAHDVRVEGLRERYTRPGLGLAMIGFRRNEGREPVERFYPPEGITRPVTALVRIGTDGSGELELHDAWRTTTIRVGERELDLAADYTAPYAWLLARTEYGRLRLTATLDSEVYRGRTGIYLLEPYDPGKIPLLMVHGLASSPVTWRELTNEVFGTADLRSGYQVWHYVYPTGVPFLHAAATFRADLADARRFFDPSHNACGSDDLVVVAHSKGGLLAKTLVADSGAKLWDELFLVPPQALHGDPDDIAEMTRFLFFEHDPSVRRVVFLATPHRGSRVADNPIARAVASFVKRPQADAATLAQVLDANVDVLTEHANRLRVKGLPTGPGALSPDDPLLRTLAELPIDDGVIHHTIVADKRAGAGSDGVVEHRSSAQRGAASQLIVTGVGHDVHSDPRALADIVRVLREHLDAAAQRGCAADRSVR